MTLKAAIAATRFGLGAAEGEIETAADDPKGWLLGQLSPAAAARFPDDGLKSSREHVIALQAYFAGRGRRRRGRDAATDEAPQFDPDKVKAFRRAVRATVLAEVTARTTFGAATTASFHERLVRFWANHFTVSGLKATTATLAGAYEREAIRPNILGSFADLARAAVFHPAMLVYLDNWRSIGPNSRAGRRAGRGLNENLAREALELHTVTPAAGYDQRDVTEFARALTGWTVGGGRLRRAPKGETAFAEFLHEPGARTILGRRYAESGRDQAQAILKDLCARAETARNIAFKLARHMIADAPPPALVDRLASVFIRTDGDLPSLYAALLDAPEAWAPEARKVKTPDEVLTSTARLMGLPAVFAGDPRGVFESLAQRPFAAPSPEGWPDEADAWLGPDALMKRVEWANRVAARADGLDARDMLAAALGARATEATLTAVARAESGAQALALALMSPDFQRR